MKKLLVFFSFVFLLNLGCQAKTENPTANEKTLKTANVETSPAPKPGNQQDSPPSAGNVGSVPVKNEIVASINGQAITEQEMMSKLAQRLSYDMKRNAIDQMIEERLLDEEAEKRNLTIPELLKKEVQDKVVEPSAQEIQALYDQNKARLGGKTLEEVKPQITAQLKSKQSGVFQDNLIDRLTAKADVTVYIEPPRVNVSVGNGPSKGPVNAPVTIVEFTDYECPYCGKVRPTLNEISNLYKKEVRYVVRNFPLAFHNSAKKAATAALCAHEQGKYWEYSDKLWQNQRALGVDNLKKYAQETGLNASAFNTCLDQDKTLPEVLKDQEDGSKIGVTGTPAFFINGQKFTGAQPVEAFKKIIEQELRDSKKKKG